MTIKSPALVVNRLIDALPNDQQNHILEHCTPIQLEFGDILCKAGSLTTHVYFPLTGVISLLASVSGQRPVGMGIIGCDGMLGATIALGNDTCTHSSVVLVPGSAMRVPASRFRDQLNEFSYLHDIVDRYIFVVIEQLTQTAACNYFHEVRPRLARWLLMMHDRVNSDSFELTHMFLSEMLGVRRSAISIAAGELQSQKLIRYSRGHISILSRHGLESASCECYSRERVINRLSERVA